MPPGLSWPSGSSEASSRSAIVVVEFFENRRADDPPHWNRCRRTRLLRERVRASLPDALERSRFIEVVSVVMRERVVKEFAGVPSRTSARRVRWLSATSRECG
jgi:hypothetical protein